MPRVEKKLVTMGNVARDCHDTKMSSRDTKMRSGAEQGTRVEWTLLPRVLLLLLPPLVSLLPRLLLLLLPLQLPAPTTAKKA